MLTQANDLDRVYPGLEWLGGDFPSMEEPWPSSPHCGAHHGCDDGGPEAERNAIQAYARNQPWRWPGRPHLFFSDMHADTDAFLRSLIASRGVVKTGPQDGDLALTGFGRQACFVIGGDCFDKGPENLRLLRALKSLRDTGADIVILVGNHDLRTYLGLACPTARDPRHAHLFVRMGKKTVPLFREIFDQYLSADRTNLNLLTDGEVRERLFPDDSWYREFPAAVEGILSDMQIDKELKRIREKSAEFQTHCELHGLSLGMVYAALEKARALFLDPAGEFFWFFDKMRLAHQAGSFLMVHAGLDDHIADIIRDAGVAAVNAAYRRAIGGDLFELYNGPLGNVFRTKYRQNDFPLTATGLKNVHAAGIYAVIHGHRNLLAGQRMTLRSGLLNFECDASVDSGTRRLEGLSGPGGAVTILHPDACVLGISADYPKIKKFSPVNFCQLTTII